MAVYLFNRGTPKAFGTDEKASKLAVEIITKGWDKLGGELFPFHRTFLNMPLMHSELLSSQVSALVHLLLIIVVSVVNFQLLKY